MARKVKIGNKVIGEGEPTFVIAEIGCNHENAIEMAKRLVVKAAKAGADAVWFVKGTQFEEFQTVNKLTLKDHAALFEEAEKHNIIYLATPFDEESADFLDELRVLAFKVASSDITNYPLLKQIADKKKPIIVSTGASTIGEIEEAVELIKSQGSEDIILLHCIISYPTKEEDINLRMMVSLQQIFPDIPVGLSDYTIPEKSITVSTAAVALGAKVIEKHFTLDKSLPGNDHFLSLNPENLATMVNNFRIVEKALGSPIKKPIEAEKDALKYARRSIVAAVDIPKGCRIERKMLICKRPGTGIAPKFIDMVVGREAKVNIKEDTLITLDMI